MKSLRMNSLVLFLVLFVSGSALSAQQSSKIQIRLERHYHDKIRPSLKHRIDSVVLATAHRFNAEQNLYNLTFSPGAGQEFILLEFNQARLVSKRNRTIAYLVSIIAPVYLPMHKIKSTVITSDGVSVEQDGCDKLNSMTGVMLANMKRREIKLLRKYADKLYAEFRSIHHQQELLSSTKVNH
jgi:hypothetical protein